MKPKCWKVQGKVAGDIAREIFAKLARCRFCDLSYTTRFAALRHELSVHRDEFNCPCCDISLLSIVSEHLVQGHGRDDFRPPDGNSATAPFEVEMRPAQSNPKLPLTSTERGSSSTASDSNIRTSISVGRTSPSEISQVVFEDLVDSPSSHSSPINVRRFNDTSTETNHSPKAIQGRKLESTSTPGASANTAMSADSPTFQVANSGFERRSHDASQIVHEHDYSNSLPCGNSQTLQDPLGIENIAPEELVQSELDIDPTEPALFQDVEDVQDDDSASVGIPMEEEEDDELPHVTSSKSDNPHPTIERIQDFLKSADEVESLLDQPVLVHSELQPLGINVSGISAVQDERVQLSEKFLFEAFGKIHAGVYKRDANQRRTENPSKREDVICDICSLPFKTNSAFLIHFRHAHGERGGSFKCSSCSEIYFRRSSAVMHLVNAQEKTRWGCRRCERMFRTREERNAHSKSEHPHFVCKVCKKEFHVAEALRVHLDTYHGDVTEPMKCRICSETFMNKQMLYRHEQMCRRLAGVIESRGSGGLKKALYPRGPFKRRGRPVGTTGITYNRKRKYAVGVAKKIERRILVRCQYCHLRFPDKQATEEHETTYHTVSPDEDERHECRECGKQFQKPLDLRKHLREHPVIAPFKCSECGKGFRTQGGRAKHESLDHRGETFTCFECGAHYKTKNCYNDHVAAEHGGEPSYICDTCDRPFFYYATFFDHKRKCGQ